MSDNEEIENKFTDEFFRTANKEMAELGKVFDEYRIALRRKKFEGEDGEKDKGFGFYWFFELFYDFSH